MEASYTIPRAITERYVINALIYQSERTETYHIIDKEDDKYYLMKVRRLEDKTITDNEEATLKKLEENGIDAPRLVFRIDTDDRCFLIRDYVDGITLEYYAEGAGFISEENLILIGIEILKKLHPLHSLADPVIHRDIKPRNILINGSVLSADKTSPIITLIDYDTARVFKENVSSDTRFMGTLETAAPEQYGFAQSDARTDIYGVGKTLIYLATGTYDENELSKYRYSRRLKRLLFSCVSLDKNDRPDTAMAMIHSLKQILKRNKRLRRIIFFTPGASFQDTLNDDHRTGKHIDHRVIYFDGSYIDRTKKSSSHRALFAAGIFVLVCVMIIGVYFFAINNNKGNDDPVPKSSVEEGSLSPAPSEANGLIYSASEEAASDHSPSEKVDFGGSASMEKAIKTALGVSSDADVTYGDLSKIECIFAIGDSSFTGADSYRNTDNEDQLLHTKNSVYQEPETVSVGPGDIDDISLLGEMKNLKRVYLAHQLFSDLTPLSHLELIDLAIYDCPVRDYTPLTALKDIERLVLMDTKGHDISFLSELTYLSELCIGRMSVNNLNVLLDIPIEKLQFEKCIVEDDSYDVIGRMNMLDTLTLWNTTEDIIKKIGSSKSIQRLEIYWTKLKDLTVIGDMPSLRNLSVNCATLDSMKGVENMNLNYVFPCRNVGLKWLLNCPTVSDIEITSIKKIDWDIIERSNVKTVFASKKQIAESKKVLKDPSFEVTEAW